MKKIVCSLYLKTKHLVISIKQWKQFHLMDNVMYQGKKCFINNGTQRNNQGETLWGIVEKEWGESKTRNSYLATDKELKRCLSWFNVKNALLHHYNWWYSYWYGIELRKMLNHLSK